MIYKNRVRYINIPIIVRVGVIILELPEVNPEIVGYNTKIES